MKHQNQRLQSLRQGGRRKASPSQGHKRCDGNDPNQTGVINIGMSRTKTSGRKKNAPRGTLSEHNNVARQWSRRLRPRQRVWAHTSRISRGAGRMKETGWNGAATIRRTPHDEGACTSKRHAAGDSKHDPDLYPRGGGAAKASVPHNPDNRCRRNARRTGGGVRRVGMPQVGRMSLAGPIGRDLRGRRFQKHSVERFEGAGNAEKTPNDKTPADTAASRTDRPAWRARRRHRHLAWRTE